MPYDSDTTVPEDGPCCMGHRRFQTWDPVHTAVIMTHGLGKSTPIHDRAAPSFARDLDRIKRIAARAADPATAEAARQQGQSTWFTQW